jgi:negative regulator of replication initiation
MLTLQEHSNLKNKEKDNVYSKELFDEFADYVREYLFPREYKEEKRRSKNFTNVFYVYSIVSYSFFKNTQSSFCKNL